MSLIRCAMLSGEMTFTHLPRERIWAKKSLERDAVVGHHAEILGEESLSVKVRVNSKGLVGEDQRSDAVERKRYGVQATGLSLSGIQAPGL